jgi:hypothetical protein
MMQRMTQERWELLIGHKLRRIGMDEEEQLRTRLSFLDSGATEEYGIRIEGLGKIVKNKTAQLHVYIRIRNLRTRQTFF